MIGQTLGHYQIVEKIGAGGMGEVYRAHDQHLQRDVALKILPAGLLADESLRKRFRREALAISKLNHPNIATVFDFATQDGVDFLAMEFIRGAPLTERVKAGPLPNKEILRMGVQLLEGLAAAHEEGVIHRDLKPGNLMITSDARLKILDFGLATLVNPEGVQEITLSITDATSVSGTVPYMSPEQLRGQPADARSDIYAAGVVLYEMATGQRPFPQSRSAELIGAILLQTPAPPSTHNRQVSPALDSIVMKALEKEPARRYDSASELLAALEVLTTGVTTVRMRTRRTPMVLGISALSVIVLAAILLGSNVGGVRERLFHRGDAEKEAGGLSGRTVTARRSVAVLGFKNLSGRLDAAWLSTALAEMFTTELAAGEKLRTISGENVGRMKIDLSLVDADSYAKDTLSRIQMNLGTDSVVVGSYVALGEKAGGQIRLDVRLQDTRAGETIASVAESGTEAQLFDLVSRAAARLRVKLGVEEVSAAEAAGVRASLTASPLAARLYAEGLAKLRVFDALAARDLLEKAVAADSHFPLAQAVLAAAWRALGYDAKSKETAKKAFDLSGNLSREDRLSVEARYRETTGEWNKAVEIYRSLFGFFPDNLDYGLSLASAQTTAGKGRDALVTIEALRKLPDPAPRDPRIYLAEASAAQALGDSKREQVAAAKAAELGTALGARLLIARARVAEGWALYELGERNRAILLFKEARAIYDAAGDRRGGAAALNGIATITWRQGDLAGAKKEYEEMLQIARSIGSKALMAAAYTNMASLLKSQGNLSVARENYQKALLIASERGNPQLVASIRYNIANALSAEGKLGAAKKAFEETLESFREIGDQNSVGKVLNTIGTVHLRKGDLIAAKKAFEESLTTRREIKDKLGIAGSQLDIAWVLVDRGELLQAQETVLATLVIFRETGDKRLLSDGFDMLAEILLVLGDVPAARKNGEDALQIRSTLGQKLAVQSSGLFLASLSIEEGQPEQAEAPARKAAEEFGRGKLLEDEGTAFIILARSLLGQKKFLEANKAIERARAPLEKSENLPLRISLAITSARVLAASGKPADLALAEKNLQSTLAEATRIGFVGYQFEARLALGEIELKSGDAVKGRAGLAALEKEAKAKGFGLIARKAIAAKKS